MSRWGVALALAALFAAGTAIAGSDGGGWRKHAAPVWSNYPADAEKSFTGDPAVLRVGKRYYLWYASLLHYHVPEAAPYSGCDYTGGNPRCGLAIELATSPDGVRWQRRGGTRPGTPEFRRGFILRHDSDRSWNSFTVETPAVVFDPRRRRFEMWYTGTAARPGSEQHLATQQVGYAESRDGIQWRKYDDRGTRGALYAVSDPVLRPRADGWDNLFVGDPTVILDGRTYKMWYGGGTTRGGATVSIGYAESRDGVHWTASRRPVLVATRAEGFVTGPHVVKAGRRYELWYYAGKQPGIKHATSTDGIRWTRRGFALRPGPRGSWDEGEASAPYVLVSGRQYRMYYTGSSCPMDEARRPRKSCTPHIKIGLALKTR
jgi:hypothetical protein